MVAAENGDFGWVLDLEGKEETDGLDALPSSIHVVAQEEIGGFGWEATVLKQPQHVVVLAVDVSADLDWGGHFYEHRLLHEDGLDGTDET